jgi:hypothetical protein
MQNAKDITMITGIVRISYPNLFKAAPNPSGKMVFSACLLIRKDDLKTIAEVQATIAKAIERGKEKLWKGKLPKFNYQPLRDGDEELASGQRSGKEYEGCFFINASSETAPGVVGPDAKPLMSQDDLFAGCYVRADVNAFPFSKSGNNGVGWGLNNVMFVREGERLDGRQKAEDAFSEFANIDTGEESGNTELA